MKINLGATPLSALYVGATKVYPSPAPAISSVATVADLPAGGPAAGQPTHIFVVADSNVYEWKGGKWVLIGLTGVGGWADVSAVTGAVNNAGSTYTDAVGVTWRYWQWNGAGTAVITAGILDVAVVGGGSNTAMFQNGGRAMFGLHKFTAGTQAVGVGTSGSTGGESRFGPLTAAPQGGANAEENRTGAGGTMVAPKDGYTSSITGTAVEYGAAYLPSRGPGGPDTAGTVIVRRPA